jgi:hypothetical protein
MFLRTVQENLLDILERRLDKKFTKVSHLALLQPCANPCAISLQVLWQDNDVWMEPSSYLQQLSEKLDHFDFVQPFELACWLRPQYDKSNCLLLKPAFPVYSGRALNGNIVHTGFSQAFRRDFLKRIGGFLGM